MHVKMYAFMTVNLTARCLPVKNAGPFVAAGIYRETC
jgi:hypothetical protein